MLLAPKSASVSRRESVRDRRSSAGGESSSVGKIDVGNQSIYSDKSVNYSLSKKA